MVTVGATTIESPDPTDIPPQLPEYQFQLAPVPSTPPNTDRVVDWLGHVGSMLTEALVAAVELVFVTFTVTETHPVVLQTPSART